MVRVCVLMTTYNPRKYVVDQVNSILNQKDVEVKLIIRDDASRNKEWLKKLPRCENIIMIHGENNLGVAHNIMSLIEYAYKNESNYEYFAYSDQDDVWEEDKLITAIGALESLDQTKPCLYYSNLQVVDEKLENGFQMFRSGVVKNTLAQSLAQIFTFACTTVFNYHMIVELMKRPIDYMGFDHLLYYIAIIKGNVVYDDVPHILYRQHGDNVSGVKKNGIKYFASKISKVFKRNTEDKARAGGGSFKDMAKYIKKYFYNDLTNQEKSLVDKVAAYDGIISRIDIIMDSKIKAGYMPKDLYGSLRLLIGRY